MRRIFITIIALATVGVLPSPSHAYMTPEDLFDVPAEAQTSDTPRTSEEQTIQMELRDRIFYRNGETKTISPEAEPAIAEESAALDPTEEETAAVYEPPTELTEPEPLTEEELLIQETGEQVPHEAAQTRESVSPPSALIIAGAVIGVIVLGGILFMILRFKNRFRPTLSKEAMAPPPIAA
ncbi:MAG: hypothetical protein Greene041662_672, partial [Candidatus Peregrinibacteria bacterium Greene0416_62]